MYSGCASTNRSGSKPINDSGLASTESCKITLYKYVSGRLKSDTDGRFKTSHLRGDRNSTGGFRGTPFLWSCAMSNHLKVAIIDTISSLYRKGWSQRRIARELEIDRETVARYIRHVQAAPKPANAPSGSDKPEPASKPANLDISYAVVSGHDSRCIGASGRFHGCLFGFRAGARILPPYPLCGELRVNEFFSPSPDAGLSRVCDWQQAFEYSVE
jgi:hypothetical protein